MSQDAPVKYCKDCKYILLNSMFLADGKAGLKHSFCQLSTNNAPRYDLVAPEVRELQHCASMRSDGFACGPDGKLWEAKESSSND